MNTGHLTTEELTNYILNGAIEKPEGKELVRYVNSLVSDIEKRIDEAYEDGYDRAVEYLVEIQDLYGKDYDYYYDYYRIFEYEVE